MKALFTPFSSSCSHTQYASSLLTIIYISEVKVTATSNMASSFLALFLIAIVILAQVHSLPVGNHVGLKDPEVQKTRNKFANLPSTSAKFRIKFCWRVINGRWRLVRCPTQVLTLPPRPRTNRQKRRSCKRKCKFRYFYSKKKRRRCRRKCERRYPTS